MINQAPFHPHTSPPPLSHLGDDERGEVRDAIHLNDVGCALVHLCKMEAEVELHGEALEKGGGLCFGGEENDLGDLGLLTG